MNPAAFHELAQAFPEPLLLLDRAGRVLATSPACRSAGLWDERVDERLLHELVSNPKDDVDRYLRACRGTAQPLPGAFEFRGCQGRPVVCRCRGTALGRSTGPSSLTILLRLTPRGKGTSDGFAALTDQVERLDTELRAKHNALTALRSREQHLSGLLDTTQDAVVFINDEHDVVRFNAAAETMFGYAADEVLGRPVTGLMPEHHASRHEDYIRRYEDTGVAHAIGRIREVTARRKDGTEFPIELSVTPAVEGDDVRYAAFLRDISERIKLQAELLANERLVAIGTTSAKFAHEVANPLNGMFMHAQLLSRRFDRSEDPVDPRVVRSVALIRDEIRRLMRLLEEFRSMSARQEFRLAPTSLRQLLHDCMEEHDVEYDAQGVRRVAELGQDPALVDADRDKLKQALLNLCKNAVEAMRDGGTLKVRLSTDAQRIRLAIEDTGCGIPEGVDVFKPFTTTKERGTGLGLPVVRQIIAAHRGTIRHESTPGSGTTFFIELPPAQSQQRPHS